MPPFLSKEPQTWAEECRAIARSVLGASFSDQELMDILWEWTGYPDFFDRDPRKEVRKQLEEFREGRRLPKPLDAHPSS